MSKTQIFPARMVTGVGPCTDDSMQRILAAGIKDIVSLGEKVGAVTNDVADMKKQMDNLRDGPNDVRGRIDETSQVSTAERTAKLHAVNALLSVSRPTRDTIESALLLQPYDTEDSALVYLKIAAVFSRSTPVDNASWPLFSSAMAEAVAVVKKSARDDRLCTLVGLFLVDYFNAKRDHDSAESILDLFKVRGHKGLIRTVMILEEVTENYGGQNATVAEGNIIHSAILDVEKEYAKARGIESIEVISAMSSAIMGAQLTLFMIDPSRAITDMDQLVRFLPYLEPSATVPSIVSNWTVCSLSTTMSKNAANIGVSREAASSGIPRDFETTNSLSFLRYPESVREFHSIFLSEYMTLAQGRPANIAHDLSDMITSGEFKRLWEANFNAPALIGTRSIRPWLKKTITTLATKTALSLPKEGEKGCVILPDAFKDRFPRHTFSKNDEDIVFEFE